MALSTVSRRARFPRGRSVTKRHARLSEVGGEALHCLPVRRRLEDRQVGRTAPAEVGPGGSRPSSSRTASTGAARRRCPSGRSRARDEDPPRRRDGRFEDLEGVVVTGGLEERRVPVEGARRGRREAAGSAGRRGPGPSPSTSRYATQSDPRPGSGTQSVGAASRSGKTWAFQSPVRSPCGPPLASGWCVRRASGPVRAAARSCATASSASFAAQGDEAPSGRGPSWWSHHCVSRTASVTPDGGREEERPGAAARGA